MDFNFYDRYKDYTATQLLQMLKNPQHYQPAALEAVNRIIAERGLTKENLEQVDVISAAPEEVVADGKQDLLPEHWEETKPPKWVTVVLVLVALQYTWNFFTTFYSFYRYISVSLARLNYFLWYWPLISIPVTGYLLLKRRPWGWILFFVQAMFFLLMMVVSIAITGLPDIDFLGNPMFLIGILGRIALNAAFLFFFWKPVMLHYFGITEPVRKKTFIAGGIASLVFVFILNNLS